MRSQTYHASLRNPPSVTSEFLARPENDPLWRREVSESKLIAGHSGEIGATYHERVSWEGIRAVVPLTLVEHVVGERLVLVSQEAGYRGVSEYAFDESNGGTELTLTQSIETSGAIVLVEPFMWGVVSHWLERDIQGIDEAIDRAGSQSA